MKLENYTVEEMFKKYPGLEQLFESGLSRIGRATGSIDAVNAVCTLEILSLLRYFKKVADRVYPEVTQEIYAKEVETKTANNFELETIEGLSLSDMEDNPKKLRKYIVEKGYADKIKKFEQKPAKQLLKAILNIENETEESEDLKEETEE